MTYDMRRLIVAMLGLILFLRSLGFAMFIAIDFHSFSVKGWHPYITLGAIGIGLMVGSLFAER